jgi:formate-dependent nitrite reductase membrane component NrfD
MTPEIIYEVQSGPFWDWRVALDLFLGGAGSSSPASCW